MGALDMTSLVGGAAALCSMASFTPQLLKIWKERDASSISLRMYIVTVTGFTLWSVYGFMSKSPPVIVANLVCLALSGAILALKWKFSRRGEP
ncbi:MAG TPA: SemiSWEET transporter [Phenylobacterium sp.]